MSKIEVETDRRTLSVKLASEYQIQESTDLQDGINVLPTVSIEDKQFPKTNEMQDSVDAGVNQERPLLDENNMEKTGQALLGGSTYGKGKSSMYDAEFNSNWNRASNQINDLNKFFTSSKRKKRKETKETPYKNFDDDYPKYLSEMSDFDQTIVLNEPTQLLKPKVLEKKQREKFINDLKQDRKVDSYTINSQPILPLLLDDENQNKPESYLHPETLEIIKNANITEQKVAAGGIISSITDEDAQDASFKFRIVSVDLDHYAYNPKSQFMIVKVIEEAVSKTQHFMFQTIRIYRECIQSIDKKQEGQKSLIGLLSFNRDDGKPKEYRYLLIKSFIIQDSGPMPFGDLGYSNIQCPSVIYNGSCIYFFTKSYHEAASSYVLNKINLDAKQLLQLSMDKLEDYTLNVEHQNNIGVYFAQDGQTKGIKLNYSDTELASASANEDSFLKSQFIQVVEQDLEAINIFSLKDLSTQLSVNLKTSEQKNYIKNDKYIGSFVLRGGPENSKQIERILNFQKENRGKMTDHFVSLYNNCYFISKLNHDTIKESWFSEELLCFNYMKRSTKKKLGQDVFKNMELCQINVRVQCIQQIYLFKYCQREQESKQTYFEQISDPSRVSQKNEEDEESDFDVTNKKDHKHSKKFTDYVKVHYFIDEQGFIQIINLQDPLPESVQEELNPNQLADEYAMRNEYFRRQLRHKIGHPFYLNKTESQVRVKYVSDQLTFDDTKFPAAGLVEYFVHTSNNYQSREIQNKNSNYIVASNGSAQYLYVLKQQNSDISGTNRPDFSFDVVKLINFKLVENHSLQRKQIVKFMNKPMTQKMKYVPQVRINKSYKGVLSNIQAASCTNRKFDDLSHFLNDPLKCNMYEDTPIESLMQFMVVETNTGEYIKLKICDRLILKKLEEKHLSQKKGIEINFSFLPLTYAVFCNIYIFFFEMNVYYKTNQEYEIVAENCFVKYTIDQLKAMSQDKDSALIQVDTKVQYLVEPKKTRFSFKYRKTPVQFQFSEEKQLEDYNFYLTKFFLRPADSLEKNDSKEEVQDFSKYFFDPSRSIHQLIFENIVDSKISQNFFPFILCSRKINNINAKAKPIHQIIFQNVYFNTKNVKRGSVIPFYETALEMSSATVHLSESEIISPQLANRCTLATNNSINLWRTSDIFVNGDGNYVTHYDVSFNYTQDIERVQIWDMQVSLSTQKGKQVVKKIGLTEVLVSSIKTVQHSDKILAMQHRLGEIQNASVNTSQLELPDQRHKNYMELLKSDDNPSVQDEKVALKAVQISEIDDYGFIKNSKKKEPNTRENDLIPVSNFYRTPYCEFGYIKYCGEERQFDLTFRSRLSNDCILKNIFTDYEILSMHKDMIRMMMQMKPVLYRDFDFLLMHTYQTYNIDLQMLESFFKPQELFRGQTMCDINLNDPEEISYQIKNYIGQNDADEDDDQSEVVMQLEGSLFDMLTQNNPSARHIKKTSHLRITDYLIVSLDFTFKSQIMRCKDINAKNSFRIIMESIIDANMMKYGKVLEHDMFRLMNDNKIAEIIPFFDKTLENSDPNKNLNFEWQLRGELVPTTWFESDSKLKFYHFNDSNNQKEELVKKLSDIAAVYKVEEKAFEVQHNLINFQMIQFGEKIKRIYEYESESSIFGINSGEIKSIKNFKFSFDDLRLAQLMVQEDDNKQLYEIKSAQNIVDAQFDNASKFFKAQMAFYVLGYCLPLMVEFIAYSIAVPNDFVTQKVSEIYECHGLARIGSGATWSDAIKVNGQYTCDNDFFGLSKDIGPGLIKYCQCKHNTEDHELLQIICLLIAAFTLSTQFVFEIGQAFAQGMKWLNFWNLIDFAGFVTYGFYFAKIALEFWRDEVTHPDDEQFYMVILKTLLICLALNKIMYFLRIFDEYGFLVKMIGLTFSDMIPFTIFFFINVVFFMMLAQVLRLGVDTEAYPEVNKIFAALIVAFRTSIGDLGEPDYSYWVERESHFEVKDSDNENKLSHLQVSVMIYIIWFIWLFNIILMVIILLNFLIAVISQTYERVVSQQVRFSYSNKAEMNLEYYQMMSYFQMESIKYMIFVNTSEMGADNDENEWLGLIDQIKKFVGKKDKKVHEKLNHQQDQIQNMSGDINNLNKKTDEILVILKELKRASKRQ